jgi:DNA-directed RNA polymerase alpha subunit
MMTISFEIVSAEEGVTLMNLYETLKSERKGINKELVKPSDFEMRMKSLTLDKLIFWPGGLDVRSANCLREEGLTDAYSIGKMWSRDSGRTMLKIPNLGKKSLRTVEQCLHEIGFFSANEKRG